MDSTSSAYLRAPSTAHRTPYGACMSTAQVKDLLSEGNHPSTLISGGVLDVLDSYGTLLSVPKFGMLHNFVSDGSTMRGLRDDLSAIPLVGLAHTLAGKVLQYDRDEYLASAYGLCSPFQQHALGVSLVRRKYADHATAPSPSQSKEQLAVVKSSSHSLADSQRTLDPSDFLTVKKAFCDPERSVALASFAFSRYMDDCRECAYPDARILSNNGTMEIQNSAVWLINGIYPLERGPQQSLISCTQETHKFAESKVNDTEWVVADRQLLDMVLNDPDCQEVAFTKGAYRGHFELVQV